MNKYQFPPSSSYSEVFLDSSPSHVICSLDKQYFAYTIFHKDVFAIIFLQKQNGKWKKSYYNELNIKELGLFSDFWDSTPLYLICYSNNNSQVLSYNKTQRKIFSIPHSTIQQQIIDDKLETFFSFQDYSNFQLLDAQHSNDNRLLFIRGVNEYFLLDVNSKLITRQFFDSQFIKQVNFFSDFLLQVCDFRRVKYIDLKTIKVIKQVCQKEDPSLTYKSQKLDGCDFIIFSGDKAVGTLWNLIKLKAIRKIVVNDFSYFGLIDQYALFQKQVFQEHKQTYHYKKIDITSLHVLNIKTQEQWWLVDKYVIVKIQFQKKQYKAFIKI